MREEARALFAGKRARLYRVGSGEYELHAGPVGRVLVRRFRGSERAALAEVRRVEAGGALEMTGALPLAGSVTGGLLF